jgi:hypothetical protein
MGGLQLYKPVIWTLSFPLPKIIYIDNIYVKKVMTVFPRRL